MKTTKNILLLIIISFSIFWLGFNYRQIHDPITLYKVYLDEKIIGVIESEEEIYSKIKQNGERYKEIYEVEEIFEPQGLKVRPVNTFSGSISKVQDVYDYIEESKPFTILGYQFTIRGEEKTKRFNVVSKDLFNNAIEDTIKTYVNHEMYDMYLNNEQEEIEDTGSIIETVYVEEDISVRRIKIPVDEPIFIDHQDLAQILLFGDEMEKIDYVVKDGDTIESVSFDHEISIGEFMINNPSIRSSRSLLYPGQEVQISKTNPQIRVVMKEQVVEDLESDYETEYILDENLYENETVLERKGETGIVRVSQEVTSVNGTITIVSDPDSKEEIIAPVNEIIRIGQRRVPTRVAYGAWAWPTNPGWRLTSDYGYRIHPIRGTREFHNGIDLAGTGLGSNIYAGNNGEVINAGYYSSYGLTVVINHNNGYYSLYSHLNRVNVRVGDVVQKREAIGTMGRTGMATGVHLHYSIFRGSPFDGGQPINPWNFYR